MEYKNSRKIKGHFPKSYEIHTCINNEREQPLTNEKKESKSKVAQFQFSIKDFKPKQRYQIFLYKI